MSKPDGQKAEQPPLIVPAWVFDQGFNKYHIIVLCYVAMRQQMLGEQKDCRASSWHQTGDPKANIK